MVFHIEKRCSQVLNSYKSGIELARLVNFFNYSGRDYFTCLPMFCIYLKNFRFKSPVFHYPNLIADADFSGWVQERGLYFMDQWDEKYTPLLACNDPGEASQKGGLLLAPYGKGYYIYNAYAFFRQLPFGVPGAIRLYVNLLSVGHEPK